MAGESEGSSVLLFFDLFGAERGPLRGGWMRRRDQKTADFTDLVFSQRKILRSSPKTSHLL